MPAALPDGDMLRGELYQASFDDATISIHKKWKSVNKNLKNPLNFHENSLFCADIFLKHKMLYFTCCFSQNKNMSSGKSCGIFYIMTVLIIRICIVLFVDFWYNILNWYIL